MEYDPKPPFLVKLPGRVPMFVLGIVLNMGYLEVGKLVLNANIYIYIV